MVNNHDGEVWVWTGYGEGFWVDEDEYYQNYQGNEEADITSELEPNKEVQLLYNDIDATIKSVSSGLVYTEHHARYESGSKEKINKALAKVKKHLDANESDKRFKELQRELLKLKGLINKIDKENE